MYYVLLVDDEITIINGLMRLIRWDEYGLEVKDAVTSSEKAWELLNHNHYDILISDVRMPSLDGLTLIKKIHERSLRIKSILISGYDDFNYVKEALRLGIENYLLKPINEEELSATLLMIIDKLDHESRQRAIIQFNADSLMDNVLYRWLDGTITPDEFVERAKLLNISLTMPYYMVVTIRLFPENRSIVAVLKELRVVISRHSTDSKQFHMSVSPTDELIIVIGSNKPIDKHAIKQILRFDLAAAIADQKLPWFAALGCIVNNASEMHTSYIKAEMLQQYAFLLPRNWIIDDEDIQYGVCNQSVEEYLNIISYESLLDSTDYDSCMKQVDFFFSQIRQVDGLTDANIRYLIIRFLYVVLFSKKRNLPQIIGYQTDLAFDLELIELDKIKNQISKIASLYITSKLQNTGKGNPVVQKIIAYIEHNYSEDLSLKTLSSEFHFNPSYLGQIFKQETGQLFTDYLCSYRIEKAKQMLVHEHYKSRDVALRVGFQNANYFANVFKKKVGIYPTAYKKFSNTGASPDNQGTPI
jgi:two-component system response regulator YesN